jgi:hypothetical protein
MPVSFSGRTLLHGVKLEDKRFFTTDTLTVVIIS